MDTVKLPPLVGLYSDVMGSGKTEFAKVLIEEFGFVSVKFAGPLKEMTRTFLRLNGLHEETIDRMIEGDLKEDRIHGLRVSTRHLMQTLGTEWGRELIYSNVWVDLAMKQVQQHRDAGKPVVIDDMRFLNEQAALVASDNAYDVWIKRSGLPKPEVRHGSEGLLYGVHMDFQILNDGTLEDLREKARDLARTLKVPARPKAYRGLPKPHGFDPFEGEY